MNNDGENLQEEDKDEKLIDKQNIIHMVKRQQERSENTARNGDKEIEKLESKPSEKMLDENRSYCLQWCDEGGGQQACRDEENRVQALAGAFQTVISLQESQVQLPIERK